MNPDVSQLMAAIKRSGDLARQSSEVRLQSFRLLADPRRHLEALELLNSAYDRLSRALWHSLDASQLLLEHLGKVERR